MPYAGPKKRYACKVHTVPLEFQLSPRCPFCLRRAYKLSVNPRRALHRGKSALQRDLRREQGTAVNTTAYLAKPRLKSTCASPQRTKLRIERWWCRSLRVRLPQTAKRMPKWSTVFNAYACSCANIAHFIPVQKNQNMFTCARVAAMYSQNLILRAALIHT